ncbi:MAG: metal-dependent transcriptional regulator [Planctomycetota bacterium]|jgi:DtxR family Mn-dependent transcriptional regulator
MANPTAAREDYLKAIHSLSEDLEAGRVSTSSLAVRLGVRDPSVTSMLKRLAATGLVDYEPRNGAVLTEAGRLQTMRVIRRHRLLETFLVEMLDLDWSEVHEEAEVLEHHLSERIVDAIDHALGHPTDDPHGRPIPDALGHIPVRALEPLAELPAGASATVRELRSEDTAHLNRWKEFGLVPGARCEMLERREVEDVMRLRVNGREVLTGTEGVTGVEIERD